MLAALAGPPKVARKALVLAADLLHEFLAARRAEASGRTEYDGLKHDTRPPSPPAAEYLARDANVSAAGIVAPTWVNATT